MTPRAWCLPNTISYKAKRLKKKQRGKGETGKISEMRRKWPNFKKALVLQRLNTKPNHILLTKSLEMQQSQL